MNKVSGGGAAVGSGLLPTLLPVSLLAKTATFHACLQGIRGTGQGFDAASVGRLGTFSFIPQHNPPEHKKRDVALKVRSGVQGAFSWSCGVRLKIQANLQPTSTRHRRRRSVRASSRCSRLAPSGWAAPLSQA